MQLGERGTGEGNDETQGGCGQGWMSARGDRESGGGVCVGERQVSECKDETPKQVSQRQTDRIH